MHIDLPCRFIRQYLLLSGFILELQLHETEQNSFKFGISLTEWVNRGGE